jgi:hypothetical protein
LPVAGPTSRSGHDLNYPGHWAGLGLLLLRGTVGITTAVQAWLAISATNTDLLGATPAAVWGVCGVALTVGLFTAVCSTLVVVGYALVLFMPFDAAVLPQLDSVAAVMALATSAGLGLLGPGAFSIDARLFGRREIFIPHRPGEKDLPRSGDSRQERGRHAIAQSSTDGET